MLLSETLVQFSYFQYNENMGRKNRQKSAEIICTFDKKAFTLHPL